MQRPLPETYNCRLTWWESAWRYLLAVVISGLAWGQIGYHEWQNGSPWFWIDLAGGVVSLGVVRFRRRWPLGTALVLTFFGLFSMSSAGPGVLAVVSLCTRRNLRQIIPVAILNVAFGVLYTSWQPAGNKDPAWVSFTFGVAITVAMVAYGMYAGSRRELIWTLRERARQAEAEQELRVEHAQSAERERIAREMHDVLAHRISLVTMHAGALAYRTDLPPEQVRETARLIQTKAHEALADLRQVLGMLRGEDGTGDRPQPTLADLDTLMEEARTSGMVVEDGRAAVEAFRNDPCGVTDPRFQHAGPAIFIDMAAGTFRAVAPCQGIAVAEDSFHQHPLWLRSTPPAGRVRCVTPACSSGFRCIF